MGEKALERPLALTTSAQLTAKPPLKVEPTYRITSRSIGGIGSSVPGLTSRATWDQLARVDARKAKVIFDTRLRCAAESSISSRILLNWAILASLLGALSVSSQSQAQTYRATNLGVNTYATAINNAGQVVGYTKITGMDQPFLWANGTVTWLGLSGGFAGQAFGINANGQIIGVIGGLTGSTNGSDATLWANGTVTNVSSTLHGFSSGSGINSSGQVVGTTGPTGSDSCGGNLQNAFIWSGGTISTLDPSTTVNSYAVAINDAGDAVGYVQSPPACVSQASLFASGTTTILPQPPGGDSSTQAAANAINNTGQIVGYIFTPTTAANTAVLWYNGTVTALRGMGQAYGINNTGQIVGLITIAGQVPHAAIWTTVGANALDLNQLIDPATPIPAPMVLISASAINDNGWIAAVGSPDGGVTVQSYLLQPEAFSVQLTPSSISFASQTVATTSAAQTVAVDNTGATAFSLSAIQVSGDYSQTNNCGTSIAAGSSCAVEVKFAPTAPGTRTGALTLTSGGTSYTVNLTGTGAISLALADSAPTAAVGTPVTLMWMAPGTTCTPAGGSTSDGWTGNLSGSGSLPVTEMTIGKYTYGIACTGGGQTANAQVTVSVGQPTVSLGAAPTTLSFGQATTLTWTSTFATSCSASGGANGDSWSGTKATSGSVAVTESASGSYSYTLTCGTGSVTAKGTVVATVNSIPSSSGGGGGGAIDAVSLLSLATMLGMQHRRRLRER